MNDTKTTRTAPAVPFPLPVKEAGKPDLVKNIADTTFDIYIHFSQTIKETFTDKVVRLIRNEPDDVTDRKKMIFSCSLLTSPQGLRGLRGWEAPGA